MKMNRVQFQPGLSMAEFMDRYGSDDKCEAALLRSSGLREGDLELLAMERRGLVTKGPRRSRARWA
jgi:hypothetical protein